MPPDRNPTPGMPRWVRTFGIVAIVLGALVIIVIATGIGGNHGPGRHLPPRGASGDEAAGDVRQ